MSTPIEILGWTIKPEISIGDIAAIGALILAPVIFLIGFRHQKRSDQLRISRELMDRILARNERLDTYLDSLKKDDAQEYSLLKHLELINDVLQECQNFGYVIDSKEIDKPKIIKFYKGRVFEI
jgi:hypothetical protein